MTQGDLLDYWDTVCVWTAFPANAQLSFSTQPRQDMVDHMLYRFKRSLKLI